MTRIIIEYQCDACKSTVFTRVAGIPDAGEMPGLIDGTFVWAYTPDGGPLKDYCPGCSRKLAMSPLFPRTVTTKDA